MPKDPREYRLNKLFNISIADYDKMLEHQGGGCAICGRKPSETRRLSVDHDHRSGETRGLLDAICNSRLSERVTPEWLERAAQYLKDPPASKALGRTPIGVTGRITSKRRNKRRRK